MYKNEYFLGCGEGGLSGVRSLELVLDTTIVGGEALGAMLPALQQLRLTHPGSHLSVGFTKHLIFIVFFA